MNAPKRQYGPVEWTEGLRERLLRTKEANNHPTIDEPIVKSWITRLDKYVDRAAQKFHVMVLPTSK
jgi:hypothetical protein